MSICGLLRAYVIPLWDCFLSISYIHFIPHICTHHKDNYTAHSIITPCIGTPTIIYLATIICTVLLLIALAQLTYSFEILLWSVLSVGFSLLFVYYPQVFAFVITFASR